jgi:hypothetical protein
MFVFPTRKLLNLINLKSTLQKAKNGKLNYIRKNYASASTVSGLTLLCPSIGLKPRLKTGLS